jgi:hypothetical protein
MNAHNPRDKIDQRKTDPLMDRRKGEDRRQVYDADYFEDGGAERRKEKERRRQDERRKGCTRVGGFSKKAIGRKF